MTGAHILIKENVFSSFKSVFYCKWCHCPTDVYDQQTDVIIINIVKQLRFKKTYEHKDCYYMSHFLALHSHSIINFLYIALAPYSL